MSDSNTPLEQELCHLLMEAGDLLSDIFKWSGSENHFIEQGERYGVWIRKVLLLSVGYQCGKNSTISPDQE